MAKVSESVLVCLSCTYGIQGVSQRPLDLKCQWNNPITYSTKKDAYIVQGRNCEDFTAKQSTITVDRKRLLNVSM